MKNSKIALAVFALLLVGSCTSEKFDIDNEDKLELEELLIADEAISNKENSNLKTRELMGSADYGMKMDPADLPKVIRNWIMVNYPLRTMFMAIKYETQYVVYFDKGMRISFDLNGNVLKIVS